MSFAPGGEVPKEKVGVNNAHFSLTPFNDFLGRLQFVILIFSGETMNPLWSMGLNGIQQTNSTTLGPGNVILQCLSTLLMAKKFLFFL